jgi:hypothetical protein
VTTHSTNTTVAGLNKENSATNLAFGGSHSNTQGKLGVMKKVVQLQENVQITNISVKAIIGKSQST